MDIRTILTDRITSLMGYTIMVGTIVMGITIMAIEGLDMVTTIMVGTDTTMVDVMLRVMGFMVTTEVKTITKDQAITEPINVLKTEV
jgi:hypothetical protein